jgi:hypothetical protein
MWMLLNNPKRRTSHGAALAMVLLSLLVVPTQNAHAQTPSGDRVESSITLYGGYRWGGSMTDSDTDTTVNVNNDASYALAVDIGLDPLTQIQLFYSRQKSALSSEAFAPSVNNAGLSIEYYHVGGTYFFEQVGVGAYVVAGFGATHARLDSGDRNSETYPSANIGMGYMLSLGKHVGLRFEVRGYGTLINNDSTLFCGSNVGCTATIKGEALYQGEALGGLSIRF